MGVGLLVTIWRHLVTGINRILMLDFAITAEREGGLSTQAAV
jgi:hypothetical protein